MATPNGSKQERKESKEGNAFGGWGNVTMNSNPFNGEISRWDSSAEAKEKAEAKALEEACKQDYANYKEQNPGKDAASASKIFEAIAKEEKENSRHISLRL